MSVLRVVLYAEGSGETLGAVSLLPAPGEPLGEQMLGPGHVLVRRALSEARGVSPADVQFESPLRTRRGRVPRGSDFLRSTTLLQLLSWADPARQPNLAVVLVDADGDRQRRRKLQSIARQVTVPAIVAVATQEFEAWLIADHATLSQVVGMKVEPVSEPERLQPGEAKAGLARCGAVPQLRREIAERCDLRIVSHRCRAFARFLKDLKTIVIEPRSNR